MDKKHVLIVSNRTKDESFTTTKEVITYLLKCGVEVYIEEELAEVFPLLSNITRETKIDFVVILGGDGTFIDTLHRYFDRNYKYFGINLGRVGCLMEASPNNYQEKLLKILKGEYTLEKRSVISYTLHNKDAVIVGGVAFNEVNIERGKLFKMLKINMHINNHNKTSFFADGVIVATSTGSSAFNLSSGGPLLTPTAKSFVITPLCPQSRSITSLIVNDSDEITLDVNDYFLTLNAENDKPVMVIDGRWMKELNYNDILKIEKSLNELSIIKVNNESSLFESSFKVAISNQDFFNK